MSTRYKMLVTGKNDMIIDDIFALCGDMFEVLTCSDRYADRVRHIDLLLPQIFCICLNGETREEMAAYSGIKRKLTSRDVMAVLIGSKEECEAFQSCAIQVADLILTRPITADKIKQEICDAFDEKEREKEAQAEMLKKLEEVKKSEFAKHSLAFKEEKEKEKEAELKKVMDNAIASKEEAKAKKVAQKKTSTEDKTATMVHHSSLEEELAKAKAAASRAEKREAEHVEIKTTTSILDLEKQLEEQKEAEKKAQNKPSKRPRKITEEEVPNEEKKEEKEPKEEIKKMDIYTEEELREMEEEEKDLTDAEDFDEDDDVDYDEYDEYYDDEK